MFLEVEKCSVIMIGRYSGGWCGISLFSPPTASMFANKNNRPSREYSSRVEGSSLELLLSSRPSNSLLPALSIIIIRIFVWRQEILFILEGQFPEDGQITE